MQRQSLFFARSDTLGDKFEGVSTKVDLDLRRKFRKQWLETLRLPDSWLAEILAQDSRFWERFRQYIYVNCWHMNEHESNSMWNLYSRVDKGIAIQSTYKRLCQSLNICKETVYVGMVKYRDLSNEMTPIDNAFYRYIFKEKSYADERELRALIIKLTDDDGNLIIESTDTGILSCVNLDLLIERVVMSPTARTSFVDKVKSTTNKHGIDKTVDSSILAREPLF